MVWGFTLIKFKYLVIFEFFRDLVHQLVRSSVLVISFLTKKHNSTKHSILEKHKALGLFCLGLSLDYFVLVVVDLFV